MSVQLERQVAEPIPLTYQPDARIIRVIARAPNSWIQNSLSQVTERIPIVPCSAINRDYHKLTSQAKELAEARWESKSGFKTVETNVAITIPVFNESRSLRESLESLEVLNLPDSATIKVVIATNGCTDESPKIVREYLKGQGVTERVLLPGLEDDLIDPFGLSVKRGKFEVLHVNTARPGKASALNTVNELLHKDGFFKPGKLNIMMVSDADAYMEPDAPAILYGDARRHFEDPDGDGVLVWGNYKLSTRPKKGIDIRRILRPILGFDTGVRGKFLNKFSTTGCLFAVDGDWLKDIGGVPKSATEDFALSFAARVNNKEIEDSAEAFTHVYGPNNLKEVLSARVRYARGALQIIEMGPKYEALMKEHAPVFSKSFYERTYRIVGKILEGKTSLIRGIYEIGLGEVALMRAKRDFRKGPKSETWETITSTK